MKYKIEHDIDLPSENRGRGGVSKYPFSDMEVGDSFAFDENDYTKVRSAIWNYCVRHDAKFTISKVELRCWRIK